MFPFEEKFRFSDDPFIAGAVRVMKDVPHFEEDVSTQNQPEKEYEQEDD